MKFKKPRNLLLLAILVIFSIQLIGLGILFVAPAKGANAQEKSIISKVKDAITGDDVTFTPQATIPGSDVFINYEDCKKKKCNDKKEEECRQLCSISLGKYGEGRRGLLIAEYIQAWYKFAVAGVGILAVVVIMGGGLIWLTAGGKANQVSTAKDWIMGAVMGLILALMSYTLLDILNPSLVTFESLDIKEIDLVESGLCCIPDKGQASAAEAKDCTKLGGTICNVLQACRMNVETEKYECETIEEKDSCKGSDVSDNLHLCPEGWFCVNDECWSGSAGDSCDMTKTSCAPEYYCTDAPGWFIGAKCFDGQRGDSCVPNEKKQCNSPLECKDGRWNELWMGYVCQ